MRTSGCRKRVGLLTCSRRSRRLPDRLRSSAQRRHGDARQCTATLNRTSDILEITIDDNGRGAPDQPAAGFGLRSMRERADEVGGTYICAPHLPVACVFTYEYR